MSRHIADTAIIRHPPGRPRDGRLRWLAWRIGVEGSGFLGRPLVLALSAAGYDVREVQANPTAERRKRRRRAKTDLEDAEAIARETLADPHLPPAGKHATPSPA